MLFVQADRQVQLSTPLGDDVLYLDRFHGSEEISRLFQFELGMYSEDREIAFDDIVGQAVTVSVDRVGAGPRFFHGHVNSFEHVLDLEDISYYRATIVPWLWFLTRTSNCRIFQNMTPEDIVRDVIRSHGFSDFESHLTEDYAELEYCTQYRETDFNFVSRILEEFGIHYTFRHEADRHVLYLADSMSAHGTVTGLEEIPFNPATEHNRVDNAIWKWTVGRRVQPSRYEIRDFDYAAPMRAVVSTETAEPRSHDHAEHEIFDYAGLRMKPDDSNAIAGRRIEEFESRYERAHARMGTAGLGIGSLFDLTDAPREDQNREYLVTGGRHEIRTNRFRSGGGEEQGEETYEYHFSCQPTSQPFRPARVTPRPVVQGPQTAIVTGPDGEEIHLDEKARVKVRFHWDRSDTPNEDSSTWIRVAQMWAGNVWGGVFMPRIGHEVVVEFLEGDPDRPLITGSVYNASTKVPFLGALEEHPEYKTVSTILTNSSKEGDGYNGIAFQDKKGEEAMEFKAERDFFFLVGNDRRELVENDRHLVVEGNQRDRVEGSRHEVVKKGHSESIGGDRNLGVGGKEAKKVDGGQSLTVKGSRLVSISGDESETCENLAVDATAEVKIKAGIAIKLEAAGTTVEIGAGGLKVTTGAKADITCATFACTAPLVEFKSATVNITAGAVAATGVVQCSTLLTTSVVSGSYTPGAGNVW